MLRKKTNQVRLFSDGYLLVEESIPVENAFLINYRTMNIVATDSAGYFKTYAETGDSLMINHLSLAPRVVHVSDSIVRRQKFSVEYRTYRIQPVVTNSHKYQMRNFEKNMQKMYAELRNLGYHSNWSKSTRLNVYNPDETNPGLTVSLCDILRLFIKRR